MEGCSIPLTIFPAHETIPQTRSVNFLEFDSSMNVSDVMMQLGMIRARSSVIPMFYLPDTAIA